MSLHGDVDASSTLKILDTQNSLATIKSVMRVLCHFILLTLSLCLTACGVGAWVLWAPSESSDSPKALYDRGALEIRWNDHRGSITTSVELREQWGEPDKIVRLDGNTEEWIYRLPYWRWYGIGMFMFVPITLAVPIGSEYASLSVSDGQIRRATRVRMAATVALCGYMIFSDGFACDAGTREGDAIGRYRK
jgi:hypothetical protein